MTTVHGNSDERFSAYLDGELTEIENRAFAEELETSRRMQQELAELAVTRALVRSLPPVEPPADLYEQIANAVTRDRRRRTAQRSQLRIRAVGAAFVSVAAAWLLVLALGWAPSINEVAPELDALASRHGGRTQGSDGFVSIPSEEVAGMDAPVRVIGVSLVAAYRSDTTTQFVYQMDGAEVSVFRQPGHLAMRNMPGGGESMELAGLDAYATAMDDKKVVVVDAGDVVLTVVADMVETEDVLSLASSVSVVEEDRSLWARTRRGWDQLTDAVGI